MSALSLPGDKEVTMPVSLVEIRAWRRSCDIAIGVYRTLTATPDRSFAERVITNAFSIPESVAAASATSRAERLTAVLGQGLEALVVLQTQLHLAAECGVMSTATATALNHEAALLARDLRRQSVAPD
jgi:hypothetical protein